MLCGGFAKQLPDEIPHNLKRAIEKSTRTDASKRFQNATQMKKCLESQSKGLILWLAAFVGLVALCCGFIWGISNLITHSPNDSYSESEIVQLNSQALTDVSSQHSSQASSVAITQASTEVPTTIPVETRAPLPALSAQVAYPTSVQANNDLCKLLIHHYNFGYDNHEEYNNKFNFSTNGTCQAFLNPSNTDGYLYLDILPTKTYNGKLDLTLYRNNSTGDASDEYHVYYDFNATNSFPCEHNWIAATCQRPYYCSKCGLMLGSAHDLFNTSVLYCCLCTSAQNYPTVEKIEQVDSLGNLVANQHYASPNEYAYFKVTYAPNSNYSDGRDYGYLTYGQHINPSKNEIYIVNSTTNTCTYKVMMRFNNNRINLAVHPTDYMITPIFYIYPYS